VAAQLTERFPMGAQTSIQDRIADLLSYSISEEYEELRDMLGVAVAMLGVAIRE
jgi:hypothetical protein